MNWKRQYKIRHNWSRGSCGVSEIQVAERPPIPQLLVRFHEGIVLTVDSEHGLRAWSSQNEGKILATTSFRDLENTGTAMVPTSLAVDSCPRRQGRHRVVIGFEDGTYSIYELVVSSEEFLHLYRSALSSNGMLSAIAMASAYLLTMTERQRLALYRFEGQDRRSTSSLEPPKLLFSFRSQTSWPPLALSIRPSGQNLVAAIAYALPTYLSGWSVGIQEMRLNLDGELLDSRVATALDSTARSLMTAGTVQDEDSSSMQSFATPTSLSYSHPYLLVSHPDNTLTLYLVTSTGSSLSISGGSRLWGHTSSVSSAEVGGRGKAVSVSSRGDELRVWDLEGGMASSALRRRLLSGELSVRVSPEGDPSHNDSAITKGWVGFDEEKVVVLREKRQGRQALVVYDFT